MGPIFNGQEAQEARRPVRQSAVYTGEGAGGDCEFSWHVTSRDGTF
jgi:hypothetical protein